MESEERKQKYNEYVERITPDNKLFTMCLMHSG